MRLIDIEPYQKDGWILQKTEEGKDCTVIKRTPLHAIPTVDRLGVVRCKDCVYYNTTGFAEGYGWCEDVIVNKGVYDDWFCAHGERKDDDRYSL